MIRNITNKYNAYLGIYNDILPFISDETARQFLENSLYLSVFTSFEYFLKGMINNYIENSKDKITCTELSDELAKIVVLDKIDEIRSSIEGINKNKEGDGRGFSKYFKVIEQPLSERDLNKYICFKFLHKEVLIKHYKVVFGQILGDPYFLEKVNIIKKGDYSIEQKTRENGRYFISEYCQNIRNNIAHNNDIFTIPNTSFEDVINSFMKIINEMREKYESYTGFDLSLRSENVLDSI